MARVETKSGYFVVDGAIIEITGGMPSAVAASMSYEQLTQVVQNCVFSEANKYPDGPHMLMVLYVQVDTAAEVLEFCGLFASPKVSAVHYIPGPMPPRVALKHKVFGGPGSKPVQ